MSSFKFEARRATVDDLPRLKELWALMQIPDGELEKQLTDFQVVTDETGLVIGSLALQLSFRQARIHSEAFEDFSLAEYARPVLWARIQTLAVNHGLTRLWTQEQSPFWSRNGFQSGAEDDLAKLPSTWDRFSPGWLTLKLKDEDALASLDKEFALFVESEKQQRGQLIGQAKIVKTAVVAGITSAGSTNMEEGLAVGFQLASSHKFAGTTRVMLFTDERPNVGNTDAKSFMGMARDASRAGVGMTTVGVGVQFGAELATAVSSVRGGNLFFFADVGKMQKKFEDEFDTMVTELAYDLKLEVKPGSGLKIAGVYGIPGKALKWQDGGAIAATLGARGRDGGAQHLARSRPRGACRRGVDQCSRHPVVHMLVQVGVYERFHWQRIYAANLRAGMSQPNDVGIQRQ